MRYYEVAILGQNLPALTFESESELLEGSIVTVEVGKNLKSGCITKQTDKPQFATKRILESSPKRFSKEQMELARFISTYYVSQMGLTLSLFEPFLNLQEEPKWEGVDFSTTTELSKEQKEAYEFAKKRELSLIFGDTGSGKTEIYIKLIEDCLKDGKSAIFLMPEISLTPQMLSRLKKVFGEMVGVWHSKQSKKSKSELLEALREGRVRVVVGPRSTLFLPLRRIGLIVVDEEHDDSYKSGSNPRYNAKDMAIVYAKICGAKCVLGSATPSLTSYKNYDFIRLRESYFKSDKRFIFEKRETAITPFIISSLKESIKRGDQAILFLPTRANFKYCVCKNCGSSVECPFCSVSMSLHINDGAMKCHYCGYAEKISGVCKKCGHGEMGFFRMGTQEALEKIEEEIDGVRAVKFDRDGIKTQKKLEAVLREFEEGKVSLLVGTQMLSKGHDYHGVRLAVVLGLDSILSQNDFRARERALSLLIQIAGRAGRKGDATVIVQTLNESFFRKYIGDYELFLRDELQIRGEKFPPNCKMARLLFANKKREVALSKMQMVLDRLTKTGVEVVGYGESPLSRLAGKYRFDILIRDASAKRLLDAIYAVYDRSFEVDMDPLSFL